MIVVAFKQMAQDLNFKELKLCNKYFLHSWRNCRQGGET